MPKTLPREVRVHVQKARESALLAVEVYNKPLIVFRSGGYIVLMCIAWTALFHGIFFRRRKKPFYRMKDKPYRYERVDGDYKAWELSTCVSEFYGGNNCPERKNLELFIGLRNKIEHRSMPELDVRLFGECQALLFNFEDLIVQEFGTSYALNESLSLSLQFSQMRNAHQVLAMQTLHSPMAKRIMNYVNAFRSALTAEQLNDLRFSYKVFLIPRTANRADPDDLAVWFVKPGTLSQEDQDRLQQVAALIKPMTAQVANQGRYRPKDVCDRVLPIIQGYLGSPIKFSPSSHHARACDHYKVRPKRGCGDPRKTDERFCHYDEAHRDYVFTDSWVKFLGDEVKKPGQYEVVRGTSSTSRQPT
jgi:hypothetical protein